jgi:hypothetical protein
VEQTYRLTGVFNRRRALRWPALLNRRSVNLTPGGFGLGHQLFVSSGRFVIALSLIAAACSTGVPSSQRDEASVAKQRVASSPDSSSIFPTTNNADVRSAPEEQTDRRSGYIDESDLGKTFSYRNTERFGILLVESRFA